MELFYSKTAPFGKRAGDTHFSPISSQALGQDGLATVPPEILMRTLPCLNGYTSCISANFQGQANVFCQKLSKFLDDNVEKLNWNAIWEVDRILKQVGFSGDVHKWIDSFVIRNSG